jgi:hypothetical protein
MRRMQFSNHRRNICAMRNVHTLRITMHTTIYAIAGISVWSKAHRNAEDSVHCRKLFMIHQCKTQNILFRFFLEKSYHAKQRRYPA